MKRFWIGLLVFTILRGGLAQNNVEYILHEIESNNTTLKALQEQIEAQKIGNKTGTYLPNRKSM
ncbi:MAG: hypothetical protein PHV53_03165 [Fermentimonas sp.]|nr:hypothetical protein [Fermentimonas sp.]